MFGLKSWGPGNAKRRNPCGKGCESNLTNEVAQHFAAAVKRRLRVQVDLKAGAVTVQPLKLSSPLLLVVTILKQCITLVPVDPVYSALNPFHEVFPTLRLSAPRHGGIHTLFEDFPGVPSLLT